MAEAIEPKVFERYDDVISTADYEVKKKKPVVTSTPAIASLVRVSISSSVVISRLRF